MKKLKIHRCHVIRCKDIAVYRIDTSTFPQYENHYKFYCEKHKETALDRERKALNVKRAWSAL